MSADVGTYLNNGISGPNNLPKDIALTLGEFTIYLQRTTYVPIESVEQHLAVATHFQFIHRP
jgi:hypothetical protein